MKKNKFLFIISLLSICSCSIKSTDSKITTEQIQQFLNHVDQQIEVTQKLFHNPMNQTITNIDNQIKNMTNILTNLTDINSLNIPIINDQQLRNALYERINSQIEKIAALKPALEVLRKGIIHQKLINSIKEKMSIAQYKRNSLANAFEQLKRTIQEREKEKKPEILIQKLIAYSDFFEIPQKTPKTFTPDFIIKQANNIVEEWRMKRVLPKKEFLSELPRISQIDIRSRIDKLETIYAEIAEIYNQAYKDLKQLR